MRSSRAAALAVLLLASSGCADTQKEEPRFAARPLPVAELAALPATPAECRPPARTKALDPARKQSRWKALWTEDLQDPEGTSLTDAAVTADGAVWAIHEEEIGTEPWRWDGARWTPMAIPDSSPGPDTLVAASKDRAWSFGTYDRGGFVTSFQGGKGQHAKTDDWRFVQTDGPWLMTGSLAMRWDGAAWRSTELGLTADVLGTNGEEAWAVSDQAAARWESGGWRHIALPDMPGTVWLYDVAALGDGQAWVFGLLTWGEADNRPFGLRFDGTAWQCVWDVSAQVTEPDGRGGIWMVHDQELWHLSAAGRWSRQELPVPRGTRAWVRDLALRPGTTEIYAVGATGKTFVEAYATLWRTQ